jgi:hypothetical protein
MAHAHATQPEPSRRAARQQAEQQTEQQAAEQQAAESEALGLSMARELVESSNTAAAVLEIDAANDRLSAYDLPFLKEEAKLEREQYIAALMAAAGRGLLNSFQAFLHADDLWARLGHNERTLRQELVNTPSPFRSRMELAELLTQHIPEILQTLGYMPPPPSEEWTDRIQNSMQRLFTVGQDDVTFAGNSAIARHQLISFTMRLEDLVQAAEHTLEGDEKNDESRFSNLLHSLRTVITAARDRAIPTALAAGVSAAVAGVPGGPAGMGIALLSGSVASLLASATEAAATAWLANSGREDTPVMSASLVIKTDLGALDGCIDLMRSATDATIESIRFIIRRGVFQTLQDAADAPVPVRDFLFEKWSRALLSRLDDETFSVDKAHQIVDVARKVLAKD